MRNATQTDSFESGWLLLDRWSFLWACGATTYQVATVEFTSPCGMSLCGPASPPVVRHCNV